MRKLRVIGALTLATSLAACGGTSGPASVPSAGSGTTSQAAAIPNPNHVTADDAVKVARHQRSWLRPLKVSPTSFDFTTSATQTLTVSSFYPAIVFVGSADPSIATISPSFAFVPGFSGGSAHFHLTPHANGTTFLGAIDTQLAAAIIPVTVKIGAPTATPTASPTVAPTATPTVKPTATPTVAPTATPTVKPTATPTVAPTATPTVKPTATPTVAPTATPTVKPTATPTVAPTAVPSPSACTVGFGPGPDPASAPTQLPINGGAAVTS